MVWCGLVIGGIHLQQVSEVVAPRYLSLILRIFSNRVINNCNRLPGNIIDCESLDDFKEKLDRLFKFCWGLMSLTYFPFCRDVFLTGIMLNHVKSQSQLQIQY